MKPVFAFLNTKKLHPVDINGQLQKVYEEPCISIQHVQKWYKEFSEGRTDIHDEQRSIRSLFSDEVVTKIERILLDDRSITIRELAIKVSECSEASIDRILRENLKYHLVCEVGTTTMLARMSLRKPGLN